MIHAMARLIDARDVLDPDGMTRRAFKGRVVGYYKSTGANSWDPYKFVPRDGGVIEVLPGLKIQLERTGPRFRMRRQGKVIRVEWVPGSRAGIRCRRGCWSDMLELVLVAAPEPVPVPGPPA